MGIISPGGERGVAGQAAEHEQPRIGRAIGGSPDLTPTKKPLQPARVQPSDLRVALFSGNYNYVRDGANQALNRLVGYLLRQGVQGARLFADGRASGLPADRRPGQHPRRSRFPAATEYRMPIAHPGAGPPRPSPNSIPNIVHISSPDIVGHRAVTWARRQQDRRRGLGPHALRHLSRLLSSAVPRAAVARASCAGFYHRCEVVMAPAESTAAVLRAQRMNRDIAIWARGIDREQFNPAAPRHGVAALARHRRRRNGHRLPRPGRDGKGPRRLRRRDPRLRRRAGSSIACW